MGKPLAHHLDQDLDGHSKDGGNDDNEDDNDDGDTLSAVSEWASTCMRPSGPWRAAAALKRILGD